MFYSIVAFVILLPVVVFVHEFGHFIFARINGVKVEAFSIGFGKKLFGWKDSHGTDWKVCLVPLGGYVKMLGQSDAPETAEEKEVSRKKLSQKEKKESFEFKTRFQKASICVAGPVFNFIFGLVVFFGLFFFYGVPNNPPVIHNVVVNSPAELAGIKAGDKILQIGDKVITDANDIAKIMKKVDGSSLLVKVEREGKLMDMSVSPKKENDKYVMGISYALAFGNYKKVSFGQAVVASYKLTSSIVVDTMKSLGEMVVGKRSSKELGGMISIGQMSGNALRNGFYTFMYFMALISISLGLFNLFPIPVLDGGYLFIYLIEGIIRRDLSEKIKEKMFFVGFMFIIFLLLLSNFNDVVRLVK